MDRQIPIANRVVFNKVYKKQCLRHKKKLQYIRNRSHSTYYQFYSQNQSQAQPSSPSQSSQQLRTKQLNKLSLNKQNKNLEIEKNNIILFNRISQIIRKRPADSPTKIILPKAFQANQFKIRRNKQLQTQNEQFHKRIIEQKPTIQNRILVKDRKKHLKYLSFMGRYPYRLNRINTEPDGIINKQSKRYESQAKIHQKFEQQGNEYSYSNRGQQQSHRQIFRHKTEDFQILIAKDCVNYYTFIIKDLNGKQHRFDMNVHKFRNEIENCNHDIKEMIKRLRVTSNGNIRYNYSK